MKHWHGRQEAWDFLLLLGMQLLGGIRGVNAPGFVLSSTTDPLKKFD
jgi:hypothetical protein